MSVTIAALAAYVNANSSDPRLPVMLTQARALLAAKLKTNVGRVPAEILDFATVQVVGELWKRANSNGALVQYGPDGQQSFLSSDVLAPVLPVIKPYMPLGAVG